MSYVNDAYEHITGRVSPEQWEERTDAERLAARDRFLELVTASSDEDDAAVDELFELIRKDREEMRMCDVEGSQASA